MKLKGFNWSEFKEQTIDSSGRMNGLTGMMWPQKHEQQKEAVTALGLKGLGTGGIVTRAGSRTKERQGRWAMPQTCCLTISLSNFLSIICTKLNLYPLHEPAIPCLGFNQEKAAQTYTKRYVEKCSWQPCLFLNSQISINRTTNLCNDVDEFHRHNANQIKPGRKENILYGSIYLKFKSMQN